MVTSAPSCLSFSILASLDEVAITRAPLIFANCSAKIETPPVPWVSTVCPDLMLPNYHRAPRRQPGTGERSRLGIAEMIRRAHQRGRRPDAVFAQHAIEGAAEIRAHLFLARLAAEPTLEKTACHAVASLEARDTDADAFHHARAIGQWHQRKFLPRAIAALHREEIAIVDGHSLQLHQHLPGAGCGHGLLDQHHGVDPAGVL